MPDEYIGSQWACSFLHSYFVAFCIFLNNKESEIPIPKLKNQATVYLKFFKFLGTNYKTTIYPGSEKISFLYYYKVLSYIHTCQLQPRLNEISEL